MKDVTILAIETSCDETAAAVVVNGRKVIIECNFITNRHTQKIWWSCSGGRFKKAY